MKVVTTFHPPSTVVSSASCHLLSDRTVRHLAVARYNKLEVYSAGEAGLMLESGAEIWGRVSTVKIIPSQDGGADSLLVLTDHPDTRLLFYALLENEDESHSLVCGRSVSLSERGPRQSEFLQDVIVSPDGVAVVASVYAGKLKVLSLADDPPNVLDVPCLEYNLLSLAFVPSPDEDTYHLGMLFIDHQERIRLHTRELDPESGDLSSEPSGVLRECMPESLVLTTPEPQLIPVPSDEEFPGGVLVVGGSIVSFYEAKKPKSLKKKGKKAEEPVKETKGKPRASVAWPWTEVTSWCSLGPKRFLVGDMYGRLAVLSLDLLDVHGLLLLPLGEVSPSTTLSYIDNQVVFVGSNYGDTQVVRIRPDAHPEHLHPGPPIHGLKHYTPNYLLTPSSSKGKGKGKAIEGGETKSVSKGKIIASAGSYLDVLSSWTNISPIMDAVLADTDGSGLAQIFAVSGGMSTGSIRVIRNGADFSELARIEGAGNFTAIFPIKETAEAIRDAFLLATDGFVTQLLRVHPTGWERVDPTLAGFLANSPTLAAGNMRGSSAQSYPDAPTVVQVTADRIRLVDIDMYGTHTLVHEWVAPAEILHASVNESQVVVALSGGLLKMFTRAADGKLAASRERQFQEEIAVVAFAPMRAGKAYSSNVVVAFWGSNSVEVLTFGRDKFDSIKPPVVLSGLQALPRSALLQPLGAPGDNDLVEASLLVGLTDGTLVAAGIKNNVLKDRRVFSLGTAPVNLSTFFAQGHRTVFASGGGRSAVLSWASGSLQNSPVLVKGVTASTALSVDGWESCVLLSTANNLAVGQVHGVNRMQIRTIPFGTDNPVRIAHDPESHTFGVGFVRFDPVPLHSSVPTPSSRSDVVSSFKVLDDASFEVLSVYSCQHHEEITSVAKFKPQNDMNNHTFFAVGTMFTHTVEHDQPTEGRVILFDCDRAHITDRLRPDAYAPVKGCVYALEECDDHLIASVNSAVVVFKYESGAGDDGALHSVFVWNHDYLVTSLAVHGTRIFDGDAVHSVSALDLTRPSGQAKLETVARNYGPLWPVALGAWDKDTVIGSNADFNIFSFSLQNNGRLTLLERDGMFHIDEQVNKFLPGYLNADDSVRDAEISPRQLFFTSSGRIGVILDMGTELSLHMSALQRNLGAVLSPMPTDDDAHARWRSPAGRGGSMRSDADTGAFGFLDGDLLERFLELRPDSEAYKKVVKGNGPAEELQLPAEKMRGILETMQGLH